MSTNSKSPINTLYLLLLSILLATIACNLPATLRRAFPKSEATEPTSPESGAPAAFLPTGELQIPAAMGIVLDPQGNPIPNATLLGGDFSDLNGLVTSMEETYDHEWATVEANGYATGFAQSMSLINGSGFFETRLTPITAMRHIDSDEAQRLVTGYASDPEIEVSIPEGAFESLPVNLGLVEIDPLHIGPLFTPLSTGQDLNLQRAFAMQSSSDQGEQILLKSGKNLDVLIRDDGALIDPVTLTVFDPEKGTWQVLDGSCTRTDETHIECKLGQIAPIIGLFDTQESFWMPDPDKLLGSSARLPGFTTLRYHPMMEPSSQEGVCDDPTAEAMDQTMLSYRAFILNRFSQLQDEYGDDYREHIQDDPAINTIMTAWAETALQFADLCDNEKGKAALLRLWAVYSMGIGPDVGFYDPWGCAERAEEISVELARDALTEGECVNIHEAFKVLQEAQMLGVDQNPLQEGGTETIQEAFDRKIHEWSEECDVWVGWVNVQYWTADTHLGPMMEIYTGVDLQNNWREEHSITLHTHPETGVLTGRDVVTIQFPPILYTLVSEQYGHKCPGFIAYYAIPSSGFVESEEPDQSDQDQAAQQSEDTDVNKEGEIPNVGNPLARPSRSRHEMSFTGFNDGTSFNLSEIETNDFVLIMQHIHDEHIIDHETEECGVMFSTGIPLFNFSSFLNHGLDGSPPITLQEILDQSITPASGDHVNDGETYDNPSPEQGSYPFTTISVNWGFHHMNVTGKE
jgi:hypothetical protein